jgi:hypothetical protein
MIIPLQMGHSDAGTVYSGRGNSTDKWTVKE